jgi:glycosyltransferase involved in cell wall biosynthesis
MIKQNNEKLRVSVIGTAGVPSSYGGFETLVENLCRYHQENSLRVELTVYCSEKHYTNERPSNYLDTQLKYINLNANGISSIVYDFVSMLEALRSGADVILVLGVSGALSFPLIRLFSRKALVVNIDGVEWKRQKWGRFARWFLNISERIATRFAHVTICDNEAISDYVRGAYHIAPKTITYGGDHALKTAKKSFADFTLPEKFAFSVCRIEPENNVHVVLEAFAGIPDFPVIFVGNWKNSEYSRQLREKYQSFANLHLLDPIYDTGILATLRSQCALYVHGHSAGGTNPSLVEAMFFGRPILAFDCNYNRVTTANGAMYFNGSDDLGSLLSTFESSAMLDSVGERMAELAQERYLWKDIASAYFSTIEEAYRSMQNSELIDLSTVDITDNKGAPL